MRGPTVGGRGPTVSARGVDYAAIPDAAVYRWTLDDVSSGTVTDSIRNADGTVNGVTSVSGNYQGGSAGQGDGSSADIVIPAADVDSDGAVFNAGISIGFTIDGYSAPSNVEAAVGSLTSVTQQEGILCQFNRNTAGDIEFARGDASNGGPFVASQSAVITDISKYRIFMGIGSGGSESDVRLFADSSELSTTTTLSGTASNFTGFTDDLRLFATTDETGSGDSYANAIIDDVIFYAAEPTPTLAQSDYDLQPWTA